MKKQRHLTMYEPSKTNKVSIDSNQENYAQMCLLIVLVRKYKNDKMIKYMKTKVLVHLKITSKHLKVSKYIRQTEIKIVSC